MTESNETPRPALSARDLHFAYPGSGPVLRGIDLAVYPGELLAILGPNGAGKSTLLKCLAGLLEPQGSVTSGDRDVLRCAPRQRARSLAFVPQVLDRLPDVTVRTFVEGGRYAHLGFFRTPAREDSESVQAALEKTELEPFASRSLGELSGGQRQRALIARALAQASPVLLVDEPTAALDLHHQLTVLSTLAALTCDRRAVVLVTHDLNLASQFATRLALLHEGRIVTEGSAQQVLTREHLEPLYGDQLHFGQLPIKNDSDPRPFVLPWR